MQNRCRIFKAWEGHLPQRAMLIANPHAGRGRSMGLINRLSEMFRQSGIHSTVALTGEPGHATKLASSAGSKVDLLVVIGGDGTVNEILQAASPDQPPLLIVPAGTENVLAKYLGLSTDPRRILQVIQDGYTVRFDLGQTGNRRFSMLASVGFDAAIVHALHAERAGNITHFRLLLAALAAVLAIRLARPDRLRRRPRGLPRPRHDHHRQHQPLRPRPGNLQ